MKVDCPPCREVFHLSEPMNTFSKGIVWYQYSSTETVLESFWTRQSDSLNSFSQLTREVRCKDEWLSRVLRYARHGNMPHEVYCFMHGLPTKNVGIRRV